MCVRSRLPKQIFGVTT